VAVDCRGDCGDWIPGPGLDQSTMKARQSKLRGIPQFDSGRWKLRLELVPVARVNETKVGMDVDSAAQTRLTSNNEAHWLMCYQSCPV